MQLPQGIVPVPVLFQQAGYYTCNGGLHIKGNVIAKTDCNFEWESSMYHGNDWSGRKEGQPFLMQVQLHGGKYRRQGLALAWSERVRRELGSITRPEDVTLSTYYPHDPIFVGRLGPLPRFLPLYG